MPDTQAYRRRPYDPKASMSRDIPEPLDYSGLSPEALAGLQDSMAQALQSPLDADAGRRALIGNYLASQGQNGDDMLVHVNPEEFRALKMMGGVGTRNPVTGLPQFFGGGYGHASGDTNAGDPSSPGSSGGYDSEG